MSVGVIHAAIAQLHTAIDRRAIFNDNTQRCAQIPPQSQHLLDDHERGGIVHVLHHIEIGEASGPGG